LTATGVIATDARGAERWRHAFPADVATALSDQPQRWRVLDGPPPMVLFSTESRTRHADGGIEGGELTALDERGRVRHTFAFDDKVLFGGKHFAAPWAITNFAVEPSATPRIAVTGHHYVWDPGIVTILDPQWRRLGTFVHPGWIEEVRWLGRRQLLVGGYSNARGGGMVALLDPATLDGQSPEAAPSPHYCESCGTRPPVRMAIMPRTEVNLAAAAPFNRVILQVADDRLIARTIEIRSDQGVADAIYEFTPSLDLISATYSERYWDMHRALEAQGKIAHAAAACPERAGPAVIVTWDGVHGWQRQAIQRLLAPGAEPPAR
jgi:hypothetical protein